MKTSENNIPERTQPEQDDQPMPAPAVDLNERTQSGMNEQSAPSADASRKKIRDFRAIPIVFICIVIFSVSAVLIAGAQLSQCLEQYFDIMDDTIKTAKYTVATNARIQEAYENVDRDVCYFYVNVLSHVMDLEQPDESLLQELEEELGDASLFYYTEKGGVITSGSKEVPDISDSDWEKLMNGKGTYSAQGNLYTAAKCDIGTLLIRWEPLEEFQIDTMLPVSSDNVQKVQIVDRKTDTILNSNDPDLIGLSYEEYHGSAISSDWIFPKTQGGIYSVLGYRDTVMLCEESYLNDDYLVAVHIDETEILKDFLRGILLQLLLFLLVFIFLTAHAISMMRRRRNTGLCEQEFCLSARIRVDQRAFSHISAFTALSCLIVLSLTVYVQLLIGYSTQNIRAQNSMQNAVSAVKKNTENEAQIDNYYAESCENCAYLLAYVLRKESDFLSAEYLQTFAQYLGADQITVFDKKAVSVCSSGFYTGYELSTDPDSAEYMCRSILTDGSDHYTGEDVNAGLCYIAVRREDTTGLILIEMPVDALTELRKNITMDDAIMECSFGLSDFYYVNLDPDQADTLHYIPDGSLEEIVLPNSLSDELLSGTYGGQAVINGTSYYVNELLSDNILYICATTKKQIWHTAVSGIRIEFAAFLLLYLWLILTTTFYLRNKEIQSMQSRSEEKVFQMEILLSKNFRKMIDRFLIAAMLALLLAEAFEYLAYQDSSLKYLFSNKWDRRVNLFSITIILILGFLLKFGSSFLEKVILLIADNLGPRGSTVGHMICSLMKFAAFAFFIIFSSVQIGANLSYILTGAGLAGAIIGYACQGVINDLLSGLFLVFEGHFHVGDWVTVGDWRGQVDEIGMRTTKISFSGDTRIFNNSCLSTVTVWSHAMTGALCFVSIAYEEDADKVIRLIEENQAYYQEKIPYISDGPQVHGITKLGDNGVEIRMRAGVTREIYVAYVERELRKWTKQLFDEHDITIPFPQVVVHESREKQTQAQKTKQNKR